MTAVQERARVLLGDDKLSDDVFDITDGPDRKGNYLLVCGARQARVHPSRILRINEDGATIYRTETELMADCPECSAAVVIQLGAEQGACAEHGEFPVDWSEVESGPCPALPETLIQPKIKIKQPKQNKPRTQKPVRKSKQPTDIPFEEMKKLGEVWIKQAHFDYDQTQEPVCFIIWGASPRKMCFNCYNRAWGTNSREDKLRAFIAGGARQGKNDWHPVTKTKEQTRKKLEKDGYQRL